jgi:cobaltochelatase CobS
VPSRHGNPVAKKHPDFICIAAANTYGRGADRQYVGRNELDESTLDRFRIGTVPMDYHEQLERQLCPDNALYMRLRLYRDRVQENRLERLVSTRFMMKAYRMKTQFGWSYERIDQQLFAGWRADEIAKVKA